MAEFTTLDAAAFQQAGAAARHTPRALSARFDKRRRRIVLRLEGGLDISFDPRQVPGLADAGDDDLAALAVEGVGSTFHVPRLDADYTIARLLDLFLAPSEGVPREPRSSTRRDAPGGRRARAIAR